MGLLRQRWLVWVGFILGLTLAVPVLGSASYLFVGCCSALGGTASGVASEILLISAAGVLIWRWRPERRSRVMRTIALIIVGATLALTGTFAVEVARIFSGPEWDSL